MTDPGRGAPEELQLWVAQLKIAFGHPDSTKGWATASELLRPLVAAEAEREELVAALRRLRIDANRLCDRNLGGTYEADCRRSIAAADEVLAKAERR